MEINRIIGAGDWWRTPIKRPTSIVTRTTTTTTSTVQGNTRIYTARHKNRGVRRDESRVDHVQWALNMRDYICPAALFDCPDSGKLVQGSDYSLYIKKKDNNNNNK